jgi:predicted  nucleic acid-binding Zn-ribbon protein
MPISTPAIEALRAQLSAHESQAYHLHDRLAQLEKEREAITRETDRLSGAIEAVRKAIELAEKAERARLAKLERDSEPPPSE